jgi:hypothetical protein
LNRRGGVEEGGNVDYREGRGHRGRWRIGSRAPPI